MGRIRDRNRMAAVLANEPQRCLVCCSAYHRFHTPYVGEGADGARRSAQIDREAIYTLDASDPRRERLLRQAELWEDQAAAIEAGDR